MAPHSDTTGHPTAAAICIGPQSGPNAAAHSGKIAIRSRSEVRPARLSAGDTVQMAHDFVGQFGLVGTAEQHREQRGALAVRARDAANHRGRRFGKVDAARPRRAKNHGQHRPRRVAQHLECAGAFLVGRGQSKFDRRRRDAERVAERLILQQLQAHVRLRRDPAVRKKIVELLGVGRGKPKAIAGARD